MLVADWILVDRRVGLGCAVVRGWDAVTGFTAVVAVPVVHGAVGVIVCRDERRKKNGHDGKIWRWTCGTRNGKDNSVMND